ncbi:MAG TPA: TQO small subunit DoxD [Falsiroseomonas sp.]|jgi:uncharacterized membrane protein YphA (DoxX/SURF4 family)|nr:TQO small subunit DoxD [Falsiroseomonas sp.]
MRTDPFTDTLDFLLGQQPDQLALGAWRWLLMLLFYALLAGSVALAVRNWRADPTQRSAVHVWAWVARTMMGAMWFQGAFWKLPLPRSNGFSYWTEQIAENAAFAFHRSFASEVMLPSLPLFQSIAFLSEMFFAITLMLGFAVRLSSVLAIGFVLQLWLGLYRHEHEWPWLFWFMVFTLGFFIVLRAGRSLGLDAVLRREERLSPTAARLHTVAS